MRGAVALHLVFLLAALGMGALGQGYDVPPADALVFPIGVEGMVYEGMESGVQGGTLYMAANEDPRAWNAVTAHETSTTLFTNPMHRGLLRYNHISAAIDVDLAKAYAVSEDGLTLMFYLREGIRWSDGMPITADDVLFTYNDLALNEDVHCNWRESQRLPDGTYPICEKVDEYTVRFTLSTDYRPILSALVFPIMPKHKLESFVHRLNPRVPAGTFNEAWTLDTPLSDLVGNGPWIVAEYQAGLSVVLRRNPYYFAYDSAGTQLPYYDRVVVHIVGNRDVSMLKFRNGEIDVYAPRPEDIAILLSESARKGLTVLITDQLVYGTRWLMINQDIGLEQGEQAEKRQLYRDIEFREALAHLVDKESIIQNVFNGLAAPQWSPVSVPSPFYAGRDSYGGPMTEADAMLLKYDPSLAVSKLDSLGLVDRDGDGWRDLPSGAPLVIEINTADNTIFVAECQIFRADCQAVGLNVVFSIVDFNTLVGRLFSSTCDIIALGLTCDDEPNDEMRAIYHSCGMLHAYRLSACGEPSEIDQRIDELIDLGASTFDLDLAFSYYKECQQLIARQLGFIYTVVGTYMTAYYDHVGNAFMSGPGTTRLPELYFDRRLSR